MLFEHRAKDNPNWTEEWTPPKDRANQCRLVRFGLDRLVAWCTFLNKEYRESTTTLEKQLISELLREPERHLERLG